MLQLCLKFLSSDEKWAALCHAKYMRHGNPVQAYMNSSFWHGMKNHVTTVKANTIWLIGTGNSISFWTDNWLGNPLVDTLHLLTDSPHSLTAKVSSFIVNGRWRFPRRILVLDHTLSPRINQVILPKEPLADRLVWTASQDGVLSAKSAYSHLFTQSNTVEWEAWIRHKFIPPSAAFVV
jgi:hypothetical protein